MILDLSSDRFNDEHRHSLKWRNAAIFGCEPPFRVRYFPDSQSIDLVTHPAELT